MLRYALQRIVMTIPVMAVVAVFVFGLLFVTPGDPAVVIAGEQASPEEVQAIRVAMGFDQPFYVQFGLWAQRLLSGDLGTSVFSREPVAELIAQRVGPTLSLLFGGLIIALLLSVPFGIYAAANRGKLFDRAFTAVTVLNFSIPNFIVGYLLVSIFALGLRWLPVQGYVPPDRDFGAYLLGMILPCLTLGMGFASLIARVTRASMLDVLSQDFIRTAKAKGADRNRILFAHALKNASIPIVTIVGLGFASLIGGAVITESIFAIPGLGRLTLEAISHRDYPVIQGLVLVFSAGYVLVNLAVDLIYVLLDPRIRY
ncbi:peptide/nickel transport system permease protein [Xaviernesmea oryzae]|uniref:Peptide/nickel transport system permease protein n=1 Tax=Xaviernesmea oryzae TaxID=464029 RepID=A0A1X7DCE9_9HYPH|nr:ABC transporter permease [Xaviernesmea oryzae]SMF12705.1 peptide/nickel transport system permease protein [Xaviernesmea oryzae]